MRGEVYVFLERELEVIERQAEAEKEKVRLKKISEQTSSLEDQLQVLRLQEKLIKRGTDRVEIERRLAYLKVQQAQAAEIAATSSEKEIKAIREKYRLEFMETFEMFKTPAPTDLYPIISFPTLT